MNIANKICIAILSLWVLSLFACGDEEFTTTVSGKVINYGSREPIEGVYVYLKDGVGTSGFGLEGGTSSDKRNEVLTDENGEFTISLTGSHSATLSMGKEGYRFDPDWSDGVSVGVRGYGHGGTHENQIFELKANAGFNPLFESTVPVQPTDSLVIIFQGTRRDLPADQLKYGRNVGWTRIYAGQQANRFIATDNNNPEDHSVLMTGDTYAEYQIAYTRNGQWKSKIDSVYVKSFEVYTNTIYY